MLNQTDFDPLDEDARWQALARYFAGESSAEERVAVEQWLALNPDEAEIARALDVTAGRLNAIGATGSTDAPEVDVERALALVKQRIDAANVGSTVRSIGDAPSARKARDVSRGPHAESSAWRRPSVLAAAAALILVAGGVIWRERSDVTRGAMGTVASAQIIRTTVGQRDSVRLADGTRVLLGPSSEMRVAAGYGVTHREVALVGEALFDVVHERAHPFIVHAGPAVIRDVGTVFVVQSDDARGVRVVVTTGAVVLRRDDAASAQSTATAANSSGDSAMLRAGDVGMLEPTGQLVVRPSSATPDDLGWTNGRLVFRDATLMEVRSELRRWYGVEMRVVDSALATRHVTATFEGEPVNHVLDVLALTLGAKIDRTGDTAFVRVPESRPNR